MALNVKLTDPLVAAIGFGASSYPRKVPSKVEKTIFEKIMKWKNDVADWALNANKTDLLVVTAGSALQNYPWWTSRELRRTSGSHFRKGLDFSFAFWKFRSPFGSLPHSGPFWSFWTSKTNSGRPDGSWHTKRELGSLFETRFRSCSSEA